MRHLTVTLIALACSLASPARADMGEPPFNVLLLADELELGSPVSELPLSWDVISWLGGDYHRLWVLSEGEVPLRRAGAEGEVSVLYGRLFAPFWEVRVGGRGDLVLSDGSRDGRGFLAVGIEGLIPYRFEFEPTVYVSQAGDVSARLHASYGLRVTQRLVAAPSTEANVALQSVPKFGVGQGFNDLQLGLRLRYEIMREVAPYVGAEWTRRFGETADLARDANGDVQTLRFVAGIRLWL